MVLRGSGALFERARELRQNATKQENHLWYDFLKHRPEQWYRQRVIVAYIVDFGCPKAMLVVELDGMHHAAPQQAAYDAERSAYLMSLGLVVLRFQNNEIDEMFFCVCEKIATISDVRQQAPRLLQIEGAVASGD